MTASISSKSGSLPPGKLRRTRDGAEVLYL